MVTLTEAQRKEIGEAVELSLTIAEEHFGRKFERPRLDLSLGGTRGGYSHFSKRVIALNAVLSAENFEETIYQTVPHEVAHWVVSSMVDQGVWTQERRGSRRAVHGNQWKRVMRVLGVKADRCHTMDVSNAARAPRQQRRWEVLCGCAVRHTVSTKVNNKLSRGAKYRCRTCKQTIAQTNLLAA